jgi:hypothetical protein
VHAGDWDAGPEQGRALHRHSADEQASTGRANDAQVLGRGAVLSDQPLLELTPKHVWKMAPARSCSSPRLCAAVPPAWLNMIRYLPNPLGARPNGSILSTCTESPEAGLLAFS